MSTDPQSANRLREKIAAFLRSLEDEKITQVSITLSVDGQYLFPDRPVRRIPHGGASYQDASIIAHPVRNIITLLRKDLPAGQQ